MAMYMCAECDSWLDDDYYPCQEHPTSKTELICPDCLLELEERMEEEINGEDYIPPRPKVTPFPQEGNQ